MNTRPEHWSPPDGKRLIYQRLLRGSPEGNAEIVDRPLDGGSKRQLVPCARSRAYLAFLVHRNGIYYVGCEGGVDSTVFMLNPATGCLWHGSPGSTRFRS